MKDVFDKEYEEQCECEDCGETKRLQFGICCVCGGDVIVLNED
jgi:hypothetical protein